MTVLPQHSADLIATRKPTETDILTAALERVAVFGRQITESRILFRDLL
jgi:hypothetical protein